VLAPIKPPTGFELLLPDCRMRTVDPQGRARSGGSPTSSVLPTAPARSSCGQDRVSQPLSPRKRSAGLVARTLVRRIEALEQRAHGPAHSTADRLGQVFSVQRTRGRNEDLLRHPPRAAQRTTDHHLPRHRSPVWPLPENLVDRSELAAGDRHHHDLIVRPPEGLRRVVKFHGSPNSLRAMAPCVATPTADAQTRPSGSSVGSCDPRPAGPRRTIVIRQRRRRNLPVRKGNLGLTAAATGGGRDLGAPPCPEPPPSLHPPPTASCP